MTNNTRELLDLGFRLGAANVVSSPKVYEREWSVKWQSEKVFVAKPDPSKPKYFICVPYSYQNGPLHLGHGFTFTRGDVIARFKRMRGFNVLFPWAWHWTGEAVAGTSERLQRGDESVRKMLIEIDGVKEELLPYFTHPEFICAYYTAENRHVVNAMGWSVDWSREFYTTNLHPYYDKFIIWQYSVLKRNDLLVQGRHPVVWCPKCQSATGDHDRLRGEGIYPEEYTIVFFDVGDFKLAAATLRPETIFGVTNVWINPKGHYCVVEKNGTRFVISEDAFRKLVEQFPDMKKIAAVEVEKLFKRKAKAPFVERDVPVLPADFVDPSLGTGVVYSVPAHAPYDYVGLRDLQRNLSKASEVGIDPRIVQQIKPIKVIETPGLPDFPAVEIVEKNKVANQMDEKLEELTREIYSKEFYSGVMVVDEYRGLPVSTARQAVIEKLKQTGNGEVYYDLSGKVVCRSGDECVVKIVEDQWFLNFSNPVWKEKVKEHLSTMYIYPEAVRTWFINVVDWLRDWACTRKTGLGTNLPWDPSWKIETLSDSTIYPALYTISGHLNRDLESAKLLSPEILDYVFLGNGNPAELAAKHGLGLELIESMRHEFVYWYGVDLRVSAKDLVPNHLTFYLFHHTGIFEKRYWPMGVAVNGMITIEGEKMSKSRGNFVTLKQAIAKHGGDATRLALLLSAEDLDDPDWREKNAVEAEQFIQNFVYTVKKIVDEVLDETGPADKWLLAAVDNSLEIVSRNLEKLKTRSACSEAVYGMLNHWRWYLRRNGGKITIAALTFAEKWALMLSPFAPFAAEEAWKLLRKTGYACMQKWPEPSAIPEKNEILMQDELLRDLASDVREVLKLVRGKPVFVKLFIAKDWKRQASEALLKESTYDLASIKKEIPELLRRDAATLMRIVERLRQLNEKAKGLGIESPEQIIKKLLVSEREVVSELGRMLEQETKIMFLVLNEEDASGEKEVAKARGAIPLKPAIFVVTE